MDGTNGVEWWKSSTTLNDVIDYATYETSHPTSDQLSMLTAELHGNTHWFLDVDAGALHPTSGHFQGKNW